MADEILIVPADPTWPEKFEREKAVLCGEFGSKLVAVEHIGSTAVPALDAKPIIDMLAGVRSMLDADMLLSPLCALGWDTSPEFNATLLGRRFLLRWPGRVRTHHLHLVVHGGDAWQESLRLRDALRSDPSLSKRYQSFKHELANIHRGDREAYTATKADFIAKTFALL